MHVTDHYCNLVPRSTWGTQRASNTFNDATSVIQMSKGQGVGLFRGQCCDTILSIDVEFDVGVAILSFADGEGFELDSAQTAAAAVMKMTGLAAAAAAAAWRPEEKTVVVPDHY